MIRLLTMLLFVCSPALIYAQAKVAAPAENAAVAEQQKWLLTALPKYGSYKTPSNSVRISAPKIEACVLSFTQSKKFGSTQEETLIITTRTDTVKDTISIDLAKLDVASMKIGEHLDTSLSTLSFRIKRSETNFRNVEMVIQQPAVEATRLTLERVARSCQSK